MRVGGVSQGETLADAQIQLTITDPTQHIASSLQQRFAGRDIMGHGRPRQKKRPLYIEYSGINWFHGPARLSEKNQVTQRPEHIQTLVESRFADRIIDDVYTSAIG